MKYLALLLFIFSAPAWANIQITGVRNASSHTLITTGSGTPTIRGGISGPECGATGSDSFCNSCVADNRSCNRRRIHENLDVTISFKVTADITGEIVVGFTNGASITEMTEGSDFTKSPTGELKKDSQGSIRLSWGVLCDAMGAVEGLGVLRCLSLAEGGDGGGTFTLHVGLGDINESGGRTNIKIDIIEPDYDGGIGALGPHYYIDGAADPDVGLRSFVMVPGDEKAYVDEITPSSRCPNTGTSKVKKFRFFYADETQGGFDGAVYNSPTYADLEVDASCKPVGEWVIGGLNNLSYYHFRAAILDEAENVAFLTDASIYAGVAGCADPIVNTGPDDVICPYVAKPDVVLGLFGEDMNCFIATATYGSGFHKYVQILRQFRNQILLPKPWGKKFVEFYYQSGPQYAQWIADKPAAKTMAKIILAPTTAFAWFSLYYGLLGTCLVLLASIAGLFLWAQKFRLQRYKGSQQ